MGTSGFLLPRLPAAPPAGVGAAALKIIQTHAFSSGSAGGAPVYFSAGASRARYVHVTTRLPRTRSGSRRVGVTGVTSVRAAPRA